MKDPFIQRLQAMAERDPRVVLITGDLGFGMVENFVRSRPKQYLNAGVAEQNMVGLATGMALEGHIVYTYSIANFAILRCFEQIRNDAAYHDCNVNVVAMGGGFSYGALGISHHATEDLAVMRALPGLTVVAPCDDWEAGEATEALSRVPGTTYLRLDKTSAPPSHSPGEVFEIGKARTVREGSDMTLVVSGGILACALLAADRLEKVGIHCRVLAMHTVKPLDTLALLSAARETGGIVTIEEHSVHGGLGGAVAEALMDAGAYPRAFRRMALRSGFSSVVGDQAYLRGYYGLNDTAIQSVVADLVKGAPKG